MLVNLLSLFLILLPSVTFTHETTIRAATVKEEQNVFNAFKERLIEPDLASISNLRVSANGNAICGFFSIKNKAGQYIQRDDVFYVMVLTRDIGEPIYAVTDIDYGNNTEAATRCEEEGIAPIKSASQR
ncbi:hypothetical protein [Pectobacterium sp. B1J-3]|uniref:hypothetical protein n=1 Tax=Pectobacterium sp. B1J-3 TaxID=3385371 RepID=UPI003906130C